MNVDLDRMIPRALVDLREIFARVVEIEDDLGLQSSVTSLRAKLVTCVAAIELWIDDDRHHDPDALRMVASASALEALGVTSTLVERAKTQLREGRTYQSLDRRQ